MEQQSLMEMEISMEEWWLCKMQALRPAHEGGLCCSGRSEQKLKESAHDIALPVPGKSAPDSHAFSGNNGNALGYSQAIQKLLQDFL